MIKIVLNYVIMDEVSTMKVKSKKQIMKTLPLTSYVGLSNIFKSILYKMGIIIIIPILLG